MRTFGGDDWVHVYGAATSDVDLGDGDDHLFLKSSGAIDADGGKGHDTFRVDYLANHEIDGGLGYDTLTFGRLDHGLAVDMRAGTVQELVSGWETNDRAPRISVENVEAIYGTQRSDVFYGSETNDKF